MGGGGGHHTGGGHHYGGGGFYGGGFYGGGFYPGYGYGSGYYGNGYGYNSPYYYNQSAVRPYTTYATQPVVVSSPQVLPDGGEIVVFSPSSATTDVQYTLNGTPYVLKPGSVQRFTNDRQWTVEFPASSDGAMSLRYTLTTGNYKFKPSGNGLGLFQTQDMPDAPAPSPGPLAPAPVPDPPK